MSQIRQLFCQALTLGAFHLCLAVEPEVKEVRQTVPLARDGQLSIDTYKGSITIRSWDNAQVEIYARIEPDGPGIDWKQRVQDTEIRIDASADLVRIKSDYEKIQQAGFHLGGFLGREDGNLPLVAYTIKMPRTARLRIKDYKSKTDVAGLRSDLDIDTYKGTVAISGLDGSLALKTYKGDVRVQFTNLARRSHFDTYKGEIELVLPKDKGFDLESDVGRRGTFDSSFDLNFRSGGKRFRGSVNGGGPPIHLNTYKGAFRLRKA
jgi:hypothetical protein